MGLIPTSGVVAAHLTSENDQLKAYNKTALRLKFNTGVGSIRSATSLPSIALYTRWSVPIYHC